MAELKILHPPPPVAGNLITVPARFAAAGWAKAKFVGVQGEVLDETGKPIPGLSSRVFFRNKTDVPGGKQFWTLVFSVTDSPGNVKLQVRGITRQGRLSSPEGVKFTVSSPTREAAVVYYPVPDSSGEYHLTAAEVEYFMSYGSTEGVINKASIGDQDADTVEVLDNFWVAHFSELEINQGGEDLIVENSVGGTTGQSTPIRIKLPL